MNADITTQVEQSVQSSLTNFGTDYIDCLVLHSLCPTLDETLSTWKAMEALVPSKVTYLGISNTDLSTLRSVFDMATIKPLVVQNRFTEDIASKPNPKLPPDLPYPEDPYDRTVREFCYAKGISYAPWGVLWGNPTLLENMEVFTEIGREFNVSKEIACFACIRSLTGCKISILCGTTNTERMTETIEGLKRITEYAENPGEKRKFWQDRLAIVQSVVNGAQQ